MTTAAIKAITFDLDDTLWDVRPVLHRAEQAVDDWLSFNAPELVKHYDIAKLRALKLNIYQQRPELAHQISELRIVAMTQALINCGYSHTQAKQLAQQAFEVFIEARHQVNLYAEVEPLLGTLKPHYKLGALTNGNANVERLSISHYFDFAFSAEQLNASKPAADHFIAAQQAANCAPEQIIHIGDHPDHDIQAAMDAGCHAIWYNPQGLVWPNPTPASGEVRSLAELATLIAAIDKQR